MMKKKNSSFELKRRRKGQKMILSERYGDLYERAGDRCHIWHVCCRKAQKGLQMHFMAVKKSRKCSDFVVYSYFTDSAFTAVLHKF